MICPECSSENPDGAVFCNNCGERIVLAHSDMNFGDYSLAVEEPLYEVHGMGVQVSVSRDWFTGRFIPMVLGIFAFGLLLIVAGITGGLAPEAVYPGLMLIFIGLIYVLLNLWLARKYMRTGRPLVFPGSGEELPSASQVMDAEDDKRNRDTTSSEQGVEPSRSERLLLRR